MKIDNILHFKKEKLRLFSPCYSDAGLKGTVVQLFNGGFNWNYVDSPFTFERSLPVIAIWISLKLLLCLNTNVKQ